MDKTLKEQNGLEWYEWRDPETGVLKIELTGKGFLTDEDTAELKAEWLNDDHFELLLHESADIYLPEEASVLDMFAAPEDQVTLEDRLFLVFRRDAFPLEMCEQARQAIRGAAKPSKNRGIAGGKVDPEKMGRKAEDLIVSKDGTRARYRSKDGIISDTVEANQVDSGIAGYFPATARLPFVRKTAWTRDNWVTFQESWPMLQRMAELFEELNPIRFHNQMDFVKENNLDKNGWVIPKTPYSTVTVNKNYVTACHQDAGDLKSGLENFAVLEGGPDRYVGGYLIFPKFRLGLDVRTGDFVGMDVAHHWHGNTPLRDAFEGKSDWERISLVLYVRADLAGTGTRQDEAEREAAWQKKARNPQAQHEFRKGVHLEDRQKDAEFMDQFGGE